MIFLPPQVHLISELIQVKDYKTLIASSSDSMTFKTRRIIPRFLPSPRTFVNTEGSKTQALLLPGDEFYNDDSQLEATTNVVGIRHRSYVMSEVLEGGGKRVKIIAAERRGVDKVFGEGWEDFTIGEVPQLGEEGRPIERVESGGNVDKKVEGSQKGKM
jgi:hypothetical protein